MTVRALAVAAIVLCATTAEAHQSSVKYVDVTIDGPTAQVAFTISPGDVTEPLGLPADARPTVDEALAPKAAAYVAGWIVIGVADGPACEMGVATAHPDADHKFVVVAWTATCPSTIERVALDFHAFFALDQRHEAIVAVHAPGQQVDPTIVRASRPVLVARAGEDASLTAWIGFGMDHIYDGRDHISFVLALLLVVVLVRARVSGDSSRDWQTRTPLATLRATLTIITSFTVAHSISLIAASLGYIALPSRLVESLIAVSILYTAIEDVLRPDVRWRFVLTFAFGLVHGLGFASTLEEQLPRDHVIVPLLCFNLGVELGQLTIVAVALPLFWALARILGAARYRTRALPAVAAVLALVATKWLIERVLDVALPQIGGM